MVRSHLAALLAGFLILGPVGASTAAEFTDGQRNEIGTIVRDYLIAHPEVIQEALQALEQKKKDEEEAARSAIITGMKDVLYESKRQVVLGNPSAPITLVEFFDYNCGYCKRALDDTLAMLDQDKDVKIVLKEFPILGEGSVEASRVAIAVSLVAPDKYEAFHRELLGGKGHADEKRAMQVVADLGMDPAAVKQAMSDPEVGNTLDEVYGMANKLGLSGTPTYIIGDEVVFGAVGVDDLRVKIAAMRSCGKATC